MQAQGLLQDFLGIRFGGFWFNVPMRPMRGYGVELLQCRFETAGIEDAAGRCGVMSWAQAVDSIRMIRSLQPEFHGFPLLGGYKPFHLMLLE